MRNNFLHGTMAVILNLFYKQHAIDFQKYCNAVLKMTGDFYGFSIKISPDFVALGNDIRRQLIAARGKSKGYSDDFNVAIDAVREYFSKITDITWPKYELIYDVENQSWTMIDAPLIWEFIHVITIHLDISAGITEKISFIKFIKNIIGCGICENHYNMHIDAMIRGLQKISLTDTYLILHTTIAVNEKYDSANMKYIKNEKQRFFMETFIDIYNNKH